jgi:2-dehydro-3-deoxygalactonokinase
LSDLFISCDWGTTRLRLRVVRLPECRVLTEVESPDGVAPLAAGSTAADRPARFGAVLSQAIRRLVAKFEQPLDDVRVLISGMASSSIGWQEVPYARLPLGLDGDGLIWQELPRPEGFPAGRLALISGAATDRDVLRGEETQALGLFQLSETAQAKAGSLVILPGTHSKHLRIDAGRIDDFQTFMTGELFEVLAAHSILRHSVSHDSNPSLPATDQWRVAFCDGVRQAAELPLSAALFRVRTRQVLGARSDISNRAFLSGVLIGSELAYLIEAEFSTTALVLCAAAPLAAAYATALESLKLAGRLTVLAADDFERITALGQAMVLAKMSAG